MIPNNIAASEDNTDILMTILICRRKSHLGVKYVVTDIMMMGWKSLCEMHDAKREKYGQGINSMMPNGRSTVWGINKPFQKESNHSIDKLFS